LLCDFFIILLVLFFLLCYAIHLDLLSFPTRRSSDLFSNVDFCKETTPVILYDYLKNPFLNKKKDESFFSPTNLPVFKINEIITRSEEHTSELQSRFDFVCRLLLEKKNTIISIYFSSF